MANKMFLLAIWAPELWKFVRSRRSTTSSRPRKTSSATRSNCSTCRSAPLDGGARRDLVRVTPGEASRGSGLLEQSIGMRITVMASGRRRRVRRRRSGPACRHAGDRDGLPGEFLNLVRGVYPVDMPVQGRRADLRTVPRWCRTTGRRTPRVHRCWWRRPRWGSAGGRLVLRRSRLRVDVPVHGAGGGRVRTSSPASIGIAFGVRHV